MWKRVVAGSLGVLAMLAGLVALGYARMGIVDFRHGVDHLWPDAAGEFILCAIALATLGIGIRFLRFAWSGRSEQSNGWLRAILIGIGFFFPGFVFSLPLTVLWARHTWPGDGQSGLAAMEVSVYIGIAAAITCCVALLTRRKRQTTDERPLRQ